MKRKKGRIGSEFVDAANITGRARSGSSPSGPADSTGSSLDNAMADPKSVRLAQSRKAARQSLDAAVAEGADNFTKDIQARSSRIQKRSGRKKR